VRCQGETNADVRRALTSRQGTLRNSARCDTRSGRDPRESFPTKAVALRRKHMTKSIEPEEERLLPDAFVVSNDDRGMATLLSMLGPSSPAKRAAHALLAVRERLLLCTGFPSDGAPETDGPAGTVVLAKALRSVGKDVVVVSWPEALDAFGPVLGDLPCYEIRRGAPPRPIDGSAVTIEVCGRVQDGSYRNMRGVDVRATAPWFEDAIGKHALVSIGDGGNEFGMGSAPARWFEGRGVLPPVSTCDVLVVGQVSNWATLALVASLARATQKDLLPSADLYRSLLEDLAKNGVVDGVRGVAEPTEDGFDVGWSRAILQELHRWTSE
jgi:D-glutamate cyclase-like protein